MSREGVGFYINKDLLIEGKERISCTKNTKIETAACEPAY